VKFTTFKVKRRSVSEVKCVYPIGSECTYVHTHVHTPPDEVRQQAFENVCKYVEENEEDERYTIKQLCEIMLKYCSDTYHETYMKDQLINKFGDNLVSERSIGYRPFFPNISKSNQEIPFKQQQNYGKRTNNYI
jgi:hypothetical protein